MKCPKCGYISFDYHQVCPKCSKDISAEQQKLNVPSYRPEPPALLGALLGEAGESGVHMSASTEMAAMHEEPEIRMAESSAMDTGELHLDDSREVELGLDFETGGEATGAALAASAEEPALDLELEGPDELALGKDIGGLALSDSEALSPLEKGEEAAGDDITLDLGDLSSDAAEPDGKAILDTVKRQEDELGIDLGDMAVEEPGDTSTGAALDASGEVPFDLDTISSKAEQEFGAEEKDEITLNLDDLKVNETGELEIGKTIPASLLEEKPFEIEGLQFEQPAETLKPAKPDEEEDLSLLLSDEGEGKAAPEGESEESLDLDNLDLELDLEEADRK
jgi:hypothetical protein